MKYEVPLLACRFCQGDCHRVTVCYPCARKTAQFVLTSEALIVMAHWRVSDALNATRRRLATEPPAGESVDHSASVSAGLAVGMLAVGKRDDALIYAARALVWSPAAHSPVCCNAATVLFSSELCLHDMSPGWFATEVDCVS